LDLHLFDGGFGSRGRFHEFGVVVTEPPEVLNQSARILLIEDDPLFQELTRRGLKKLGFEVDIADDGEKGVKQAAAQPYSAIIVDLMLPRMHGFEVIEHLRASPASLRTPIVAYSTKIYESDHRQALALGADAFLQKPLDPTVISDTLSALVGSLAVRFWGVRGSIAAPGPETARYGGNTPCLTIDYGGRTLIVDSGTGIRRLGQILTAEARRAPSEVDLLISHTHWDHIQGFPFFLPAYIPGNRIRVYGPRTLSKPLEIALRGQMDPEYFPVALGDMAADIHVEDVRNDRLEIGPFTITHTYLNHPGMTLGFRIEAGGCAVVYATDTEPFGRVLAAQGDDAAAGRTMDQALVALVEGADLYIGDAQYTHSEYQQKTGWGHSSCDDTTQLAIQANAKRLALFSHDPMHDDDTVDSMVEHCKSLASTAGSSLEVLGATEGTTVRLSQG
jgi:DNA-binding response OmpR family regulator